MDQQNQPLFTDATGERDAAWVLAARDGSTEAFGKLAKAYERAAIATAYRLLGNSDDALEVVQEALLRAYRSLDRLQEPSRFGPWLLRIVSNLSLNARRSRRGGVALDEQWGAEGMKGADGEPVVADTGPERLAEGHELGQALDAALQQLPEKQRLALILFTIEGWAQKDIAALLDCSLENVKWYVFQGRKRLRELLGDALTS
ncbi:MAG TPA: sigma-70 family RNA polymerase sigma factor [Phycisphaerae bacterium]|nr:sigma-70 family RNA polymerase sigma factor [Phycisphaerae bacterium]HOJ74611.1 sigma-70 family RNA polymerase sigma factor [Phycisphaerae bacterium]HOM50510.1 sigma-70 family RNA polymerase sigma factor [Phycisphaerae bacterium]HON65979.1 sigma-70 family RNA polymerase sigma factor [Phycisphaerae bacterium]HOQ87745.1 sigma-70 family RNA polymerase sigma factor [Phycisphaerae bacterium]